MHVITKAKDGTSFGVGFDRDVYVHRLVGGRAPSHADFLIDGNQGSGSFWIRNNPLKVVHREGPGIGVRFDQDPSNYGVPPGYELQLALSPAKIDLGMYEMQIHEGPFQPTYDIILNIAENQPLAPCGLDKCALGGAAALMAVARNPNLKEDQFYRWAQCPWVPVLRALANNPSVPPDLRQSISNAISI